MTQAASQNTIANKFSIGEAVAGDGVITGAGVDVRGAEMVNLLVAFNGNLAGTFDITIETADDAAFTVNANVLAVEDVSGNEYNNAALAPAADGELYSFQVKRTCSQAYVRPVITGAGGAAADSLSAVFVLGELRAHVVTDKNPS
jgi:hypothetical protein